jgi:hypothetical protein
LQRNNGAATMGVKPTGMRRCVASSRRRYSSRGCSSRGCKFTTLQACGGAPARVAAVRVAASLRRYKLAAALQLAWLQASTLQRNNGAAAMGVEPTGFFGEPGRRLRYSAAMARRAES